LVLFFSLGILALVIMFLFLPSAVWPWAIPGAALTVCYPFMKRFIKAPQLVLGFAFSFSIPMVFVAVGHDFDASFWLLMLVNFFWVLVYDTQYAMSDREDDLKIGVNSTAIYFGNADKTIVGIMQCAVVIIWFYLMQNLTLSGTFSIALVLIAGLFVYQQWLIRNKERQACFQAFLNNAYVGAILWFGLLVAL